MAAAAIAVPAQAATVTAPTTATTGTAGVTWSAAMRRKLDLTVESARLSALLPSLRATAVTRNTDVVRAQTAQTVATTTLAAATIADQSAESRLTTAKATAATAKKALLVELRRKPANTSRIFTARQTLTAAETTVKTRTAAATQTAAALTVSKGRYATATSSTVAAAIAYQMATNAIDTTQRTIAAVPAQVTALAAQAAEVSPLVVTQSRPAFTIKNTTQVYGVTVNKIIAYPFQRMLDDAAKAGVPLSGGGFRTQQEQIALRTTNGCPDVWTAPSSSCRVPTAIPGRSLHEIGFAIDMTSNQKTITSRDSAAFKWLTAHAAAYGFKNLPSEPWHWSITGN